jgi:O-antigen biosynthesis protein
MVSILLNDDMTIITPDWITDMLMWCQQDGVAGVGAKLLFPDDKIQHSGVLLLGQGPSHPYYLHDKSEIGQVCNAIVPREFSAVTGACLMVRRADYIAIGGFDPVFRINYNDVDFCLRLAQRTGGRIINVPSAQLYHYESVSREAAPEHELKRFNERWRGKCGRDPNYNIHLSPSSNSFEINPVIRLLAHDYGLKGAE